MKFKNIKISLQNVGYSELSYDMQEKITETIMFPINDGYSNFFDVEVNCYLGDSFYQTDEIKKDLMLLCDLTEDEFNCAVENKRELTFYVSYEA